MPVTKQAIKKVRADKRKAVYNLRRKKAYKEAVKKFLKNPTQAGLTSVFSAVDQAAKTNVIHKNKASRIKSRLSKKLKPTKTTAKATAKAASKRKAKAISKKSSK